MEYDCYEDCAMAALLFAIFCQPRSKGLNKDVFVHELGMILAA